MPWKTVVWTLGYEGICAVFIQIRMESEYVATDEGVIALGDLCRLLG